VKKSLAILLIPLFLLVTTGVAITSLHCGGKIVDTGIQVKACCKDVNKGGCCSTKSKIVKVEEVFIKRAASFELNKLSSQYTPDYHLFYFPQIKNIFYSTIYRDKAPPLIRGCLYLLFHSLII
jgi:hypothetical protein